MTGKLTIWGCLSDKASCSLFSYKYEIRSAIDQYFGGLRGLDDVQKEMSLVNFYFILNIDRLTKVG